MTVLPRSLAFAVGFLSLVQEVLWARLVGFADSGRPESFAAVLAFYLIGIAAGAKFGGRLCSYPDRILGGSALILLVAGAIDVASPFIFASTLQWVPPILAAAPLVVITAALKSALFPVVHHLGSNDRATFKGRSFSWVYFCNVLGCTLGPLFAALWLLDRVTLTQSFVLVGAATFAAAAIASPTKELKATTSVAMALMAGVVWIVPNQVNHIATTNGKPYSPGIIIETKEGIVHTLRAEHGGDYVFGGNVYDGRINTDLRVNSNGIDRVYALSAAHGDPERVLVIGLSAGSWTEALAMDPAVESIDAVEINPGYLKLIARYREVSGLLSDPKVRVHIADGRRWLRTHPGDKFDVIATNTTFHWRANSTNLLSREFLELVREHLAPGGVALINTTGSVDVFKTATEVFPHSYLYGNSVFMAEHDFRSKLATNAGSAYAFGSRSGNTLRKGEPRSDAAVKAMVAKGFRTLQEEEVRAGRASEVITDDNMITEYKNAG